MIVQFEQNYHTLEWVFNCTYFPDVLCFLKQPSHEIDLVFHQQRDDYIYLAENEFKSVPVDRTHVSFVSKTSKLDLIFIAKQLTEVLLQFEY